MAHALRARITALATAGLLVAAPGAAAADDVGYVFRPGHPMIHTYGGTAQGGYLGHCTGGYAVAGTSGVFLLADRGCVLVLASVRGTDREFGRHAYVNATSALVAETPPDDAYQQLVDPVSGDAPADGWVQGYMPTHEQGEGVLVGKMGTGSGWTEGRITGWIDFLGNQAICTTAHTAPGDAGGPVWRWDEHGLRALGVVVAYHPDTGDGCYLPIQGVLAGWGAWLPVPGGDVVPDGPGTLPAGLPQLDATGYVTPIWYESIVG